MDGYEFTNDWFNALTKGVWDQLLPQVDPRRFLEIGSYEGASACYLIDKVAPSHRIEVHCVDTWEGGVEHQQAATMQAVEARFRRNMDAAILRYPGNVALVVHKGPSDVELSKLLAEGKQGYFDFVYVDGSHQAPDVLCDAVLGFKLLRVGGTMVFDDYLWAEDLPTGMDPLRCPKLAVDSFTNVNCRKIRILNGPLYQLYLQKTAN